MAHDRIVSWDTHTQGERQWTPTQHDLDRMRRLTREDAQFKACRHHKEIAGRKAFTCRGKERKTCNGCSVCPNCGGRMAIYRQRKEIGYDSGDIYRHFTYISRTCMQCGAYIEDEYVEIRREQRNELEIATSNVGKCDVRGCRNGAWEGYQHTEAGITFKICESHRRRVKTWRHHPDKGQEHNPLVVVKGALTDNPEYQIKQDRKRR